MTMHILLVFWGKRRCQSLLRTLQRVSSICKLNTTTANDLWAKSSINLLRIGASLRYDDKWRLTINIYICNLQERQIIDIKSSRTTDTTDSLQNSQKSSVANNTSRCAYSLKLWSRIRSKTSNYNRNLWVCKSNSMQPCGVNGCWCTDNGKISITSSGLAVHPGVVAMFLVQWCCRNLHYEHDCVANPY